MLILTSASWLTALVLCIFCTMAGATQDEAVILSDAVPEITTVTEDEEIDSISDTATHGSADSQHTSGQHGRNDERRTIWQELEPGLHFGEFTLAKNRAQLTVLRIDPNQFDFVLCARSELGGATRTLRQWGEEQNLTAAINASMYLPDGSTSTGYMRQGKHINNGRLVQRFGAFFVAGPQDPMLPQAHILERDDPQWRALLDKYHMVIQNYRMVSSDRRILWSPGGPLYSISAVAEDNEGQILFLHCRRPVDAYTFAQHLLLLPLNIRTVMYVEGGGQAGLLVRSTALTREVGGLHPSGFLVTGNLRASLPNVLGARRKTTPLHGMGKTDIRQ